MRTAYTPSATGLSCRSTFLRFQRERDTLVVGERVLRTWERGRWRLRRIAGRTLLARHERLMGAAHFIASNSSDATTRRSALGFAERLRGALKALQ